MNRRRLGLVSAWLAGTILAVVLASQAVGLVRNQVTDRPSRTVSTLLTTPVSVLPPASDTTMVDGPSSTTTTGAPSTTQPATTTTTAPPIGTATAGERFSLIGGWVTVACEGERILFRSAAPQAGFQIAHTEIEDSGIEVQFRDSEHTSKFHAECVNGTVVESTEEGDHDD